MQKNPYQGSQGKSQTTMVRMGAWHVRLSNGKRPKAGKPSGPEAGPSPLRLEIEIGLANGMVRPTQLTVDIGRDTA